MKEGETIVVFCDMIARTGKTEGAGEVWEGGATLEILLFRINLRILVG